VDLVVAAEARYTQRDDDDAAAWYASQDEIWNRALTTVYMPTFVADKAPVEVMAQVDYMTLAIAWQAHVEVVAASERLATQMEDLIR
jgi:hypothetical protein